MAEYPQVTITHYLQESDKGNPVERYAAHVTKDGMSFEGKGFRTEHEAVETLKRIFWQTKVFPKLPRTYEYNVDWSEFGPIADFPEKPPPVEEPPEEPVVEETPVG